MAELNPNRAEKVPSETLRNRRNVIKGRFQKINEIFHHLSDCQKDVIQFNPQKGMQVVANLYLLLIHATLALLPY